MSVQRGYKNVVLFVCILTITSKPVYLGYDNSSVFAQSELVVSSSYIAAFTSLRNRFFGDAWAKAWTTNAKREQRARVALYAWHFTLQAKSFAHRKSDSYEGYTLTGFFLYLKCSTTGRFETREKFESSAKKVVAATFDGFIQCYSTKKIWYLFLEKRSLRGDFNFCYLHRKRRSDFVLLQCFLLITYFVALSW